MGKEKGKPGVMLYFDKIDSLELLSNELLAREGICISEHDGIIEKDIEKTIQNLGRIGSVGMQNTDNMILDIMVCK